MVFLLIVPLYFFYFIVVYCLSWVAKWFSKLVIILDTAGYFVSGHKICTSPPNCLDFHLQQHASCIFLVLHCCFPTFSMFWLTTAPIPIHTLRYLYLHLPTVKVYLNFCIFFWSIHYHLVQTQNCYLQSIQVLAIVLLVFLSGPCWAQLAWQVFYIFFIAKLSQYFK